MASNYVVAGTVGRLLREEMAGLARHIIENDQDPVTRGIVLNTGAVRTSSTLGRPPAGTKSSTSQFEAIHPIQFGRSGAIKYAPVAGLLGSDAPPRLLKSPTYQSSTDVPQRETDWFLIPLKWIMGNLAIDHRQWLALTKGTAVEDFLANWLKDPIQIIHQQLTTDFFGSGIGQLGVWSAASNTWSSSTAERIWTVTGTVRPFWRGQRVNIYDNSASKLAGQSSAGDGTEYVFMVSKVFSFTGSQGASTQKIGLVPLQSTTFTGAANDLIIMEGAFNGLTNSNTAIASGGVPTNGPYAVQGLGNFILDATASSVALHGLTVYDGTTYNYPELFSYIDSPAAARWPTPRVYELAMDAISDRGFDPPDRWILPRGVRSLFYNVEGLHKVYNTDLASPVQRGADGGITGGMSITSEKGTAEVIMSGFCPRNTSYGIRTDALVRYAPEGLEAVQFLGESPLVGGNMFFAGVDGSGNFTTVYEAPFNYFIEHGCVKPQCLAKVGNLKQLDEVG